MAILIFTLLNGMGVAFLLYVLANFWKEGHRPKNEASGQYVTRFSENNRPRVIVMTRPISGGLHTSSHGRQNRSAVISF